MKHFAGTVKYTVRGWVLKNSDPLPEAMPQTFGVPGALALVHGMFPAEAAPAATEKATRKIEKETPFFDFAPFRSFDPK